MPRSGLAWSESQLKKKKKKKKNSTLFENGNAICCSTPWRANQTTSYLCQPILLPNS